jgi:hypothetical protein
LDFDPTAAFCFWLLGFGVGWGRSTDYLHGLPGLFLLLGEIGVGVGRSTDFVRGLQGLLLLLGEIKVSVSSYDLVEDHSLRSG